MTMTAADQAVYLHRIFMFSPGTPGTPGKSSTLFMKPEQGIWDSIIPPYFTFLFLFLACLAREKILCPYPQIFLKSLI